MISSSINIEVKGYRTWCSHCFSLAVSPINSDQAFTMHTFWNTCILRYTLKSPKGANRGAAAIPSIRYLTSESGAYDEEIQDL